MDRFATRLQCLRKEAGLSQTELAKEIGVSMHSISNYEIGLNKPNTKSLAKIARYFNVTLDWLAQESDERSPDVRTVKRICENNAVSADWLLGLSDPRYRDPNLEEMMRSLSHALECCLFAMDAAREAHRTLEEVLRPGGADNEG